MFQGLISVFSAIFSGLIKASVPIVAILAGLVTAFVTVWLERRKDQKEKLQDRKDMWLKDHWKHLAIYLENISEFGLREDKISEEPKAPTQGTTEEYHPGDQELATALCGYNINESGFEPYCKINLFKDYHIISLSHVESGYKELNDLLVGILSDEGEYFTKISEPLKNMYKDITKLMKDKFPNIIITLSSLTVDSYSIYYIFNELVKSLMGDHDELSEVPNSSGNYYVQVVRNEGKPTDIILTKKSILKNFRDDIWLILKDKYKNQIKELQVEQKKIIDEESQWNKSIQGIIVTYKIGFSIKGKCKDCEKILSEKKIINIRPPEINK